MVAGDIFFDILFLLLEMRDSSKLNSKLEIITNERMLDTCQHISMLGNHCRVLPAILLNITALLARIAQTITKIYRSKITYFFCFQERNLSLFYFHTR